MHAGRGEGGGLGIGQGVDGVGEVFDFEDGVVILDAESDLAAVRPDRLDSGVSGKGPEEGMGAWGKVLKNGVLV